MRLRLPILLALSANYDTRCAKSANLIGAGLDGLDGLGWVGVGWDRIGWACDISIGAGAW